MSTYSVAQVEAITGINAHTLRIWERRYSFLVPMRTATNIRYYSDKDIRKLISIGLLQRHGYKISKLDAMEEKQISAAVEEILENSLTANEDEINSLMLSMLNFDENQFDKIFKRKLVQIGLFETIVEVIYPFLYRIGILWSASKVIPAQEHFITNLIRQKIISAIDTLPIANAQQPGVVLFLLQDERHELGLLLTSFLARSIGWRVIYLGQDVPIENISSVAELVSVNYMMTMLISPRMDDYNSILHELVRTTSLPLIVSGMEKYVSAVVDESNIIKIANPTEMIEFLKSRTTNN